MTSEPNIWVAGPQFISPRQVTVLNPSLSPYTFGTSRLIDYVSEDGQHLQSALLLPAGYEPGKRYPMLVWVYASDYGSRLVNHFGLWGDISPFNFQLLATRGYAIIAPDMPVRVGTPMRDMMKTVMPAIDRAVALGIADPNRLAVAGQSNGGYSTLALIVQTHRFKAAIMNAGFGDLAGFYGCMRHIGASATGKPVWIDWVVTHGGAMGVPPWSAPERYVTNSPVYYLDRITTPLLMQDGANDDCIVEFSDEVFIDLQSMGKDVTYLRYGDENHILERSANIVDYWNRVFKFFNDHLSS
jgi:dipeptidyl aminopeptidase/acylaminoacyl peptidase